MPDRFEHREAYIDGWYSLDAPKLVAAVAECFVFDDPAETELITKATLPDYMVRWDERVRALGASGEWALSDVVNQDRDGILTCWEWWKCLGSGLEGGAIVKTADEGVLLERIVYYRR